MERWKLVTHERRLSRGVGQTSEQNGWRDGKKRPTELLQRVEEVGGSLTRTIGGALGFLHVGCLDAGFTTGLQPGTRVLVGKRLRAEAGCVGQGGAVASGPLRTLFPSFSCVTF